MTFTDQLATLAPTDHLVRIELSAEDGRIETIDNLPGSHGSVRIYAHLLARHGLIDRAAAREGLALFAEHVEAARRNPGQHPNIDRLLTVAAGGTSYRGVAVPV